MLFWENCEPSNDQLAEINEIENIIKISRQCIENNIPSEGHFSENNASNKLNPISETFSSLIEVEQTCSSFINKLDEILLILDDVSSSHEEITGRTNVLMMNCEALLEQQHTLNEIVESLRNIIQPFNDVEEVAGRLGIPVDASGKPSKSSDQSSSVDPRSPEFRDIILRISRAISSLHQHPEIKDNDRYLVWLLQVQKRADSLVGKTMLELINTAKKICKDEFLKKEHSKALRSGIEAQAAGDDIGGIKDTPLESLSIYTKFRSLGFRMRELFEMLKFSESSTESLQLSAESLQAREKLASSRKAFSSIDFESNQRLLNLSNGSSEKSVLSEVLHSYRVIRSELLQPVLEEYLKNLTNEAFSQLSGSINPPKSASHSISALCNVIRNSYAVLFRTSQLEQQLYLSLYRSNRSVTEASTPLHRGLSSDANEDSSHHPSPYSVNLDCVEIEHHQQLVEIVSEISSQISGHLRSLIIKESSVESLCRVIHTLSQDVISQLEGTRLHQEIYHRLDEHLLRTTSDARERLVYCSEVTLRQQVQIFEPLPSQLQYPDIIEKAKNNNIDQADEAGIMSATWYPPLKHTLALLSLLYGTVSPSIFEDIARRSIILCIQSLINGASGVRRWKNQLHGDLFLTRHLLILREQLIPFNMNLQSVEKQLDFSTTGTALSSLVNNSMRLLRFDSSNTFFQMARDGLPGMNELHLDIKKHMDETLKSSCQSLKYSSVQFLLGPLEAFLAKVTAFIGNEIPVYRGGGDDRDDLAHSGEEATIPLNLRENLKKQQFVKYDRVHSLLTSVLQSCLETKPQYSSLIKIYIDNPITRAVILKPVLHELQMTKLRMGTVISNCIDPGQPRRDLENLLRTISFSMNEFD